MNNARADGHYMVELLDDCWKIANHARTESEPRSPLWLAADKERLQCRRARRKMEETADELEQELIYCRTILDGFRQSSLSLERNLLSTVADEADRLVSLY